MKNLLILLSLLVIGLLLLRITLLNNLSVQGVDYNKLIKQVNDLHKENIMLHDEYLQDASYYTISQKAIRMGYLKGQFVYLQNGQQ